MLFARIIQNMRFAGRNTLLFFMCDFRSVDLTSSSNIFRSLGRQLVTQDSKLVALIYDDYVMQGLKPSKKHLKDIIASGLTSATSVRILIDGLDECPVEDQKEVLKALADFTSRLPEGTDCKAAVFSRDVSLISKTLKKAIRLSLKDELAAISAGIQAFVRHKMDSIREDLDDDMGDDAFFANISSKIIAKADGEYQSMSMLNYAHYRQACSSGSSSCYLC